MNSGVLTILIIVLMLGCLLFTIGEMKDFDPITSPVAEEVPNEF